MNTNTRIFRHRTLPALAGAALALAPISVASAQRVVDLDHAHDVRHGTHTHSVHEVTTDKYTVRIESDGAVAEVSCNGKHIATLDLDDDWTDYQVKGADSEVVATVLRPDGASNNFIVFTGDQRLHVHAAPQAPHAPDAPRATVWRAQAAEAFAEADHARETAQRFNLEFNEQRPRVMIGITATSPDEGQLEKFGLDEDDVVRISTVVEDGPAARAGIRPGDIILSINGQDQGNLKAIRKALAERHPGERVTVRVLRDGDQRQYTLTLDPFQAEKFPGDAIPNTWTPMGQGVGELAEIQAMLEAKGAEMGELAARLAEASGPRSAEIRKEMALRSKEIAELSQKLARQSLRRQLSGAGEMELEIFEDEEGGGRRAVLLPYTSARADSIEALDDRFEELSERLEDQLDRFEDRMDEMNDEMDRKLDELVDELIRRMRERTE